MPEPRPTPFTLVFGGAASERFTALRAGLEATGRDPHDRDGFVLVREVAELLHELRPEAGAGAALQTLVALVHWAYLFWMDGEVVQRVTEEQLQRMLALPAFRPADLPTFRPAELPTRYVQLPALRVWAIPVAGHPAEPLDGWFATRSNSQLALLAVFGLTPAREGLTAVELSGSRPGTLRRPDGSPLFASLFAGDAATGLASLAGEAELLELAWRVEAAP